MGKSGSERNIQFNKTWWCRRSTPLSPSNFVGNPLPSFPQQLCRSKSATSWNLRLRISAVKAEAKKSPQTMMRHAEICGLGIWFPVSWNQSPTILDFSHVFLGGETVTRRRLCSGLKLVWGDPKSYLSAWWEMLAERTLLMILMIYLTGKHGCMYT